MTSFEELCVRWGNGTGDRRSIFVKKHKRLEDAKGEGQRLRNAVFVAGLSPSLAEESILRTILTNYGGIKTLALHPSKVTPTVDMFAVDLLRNPAEILHGGLHRCNWCPRPVDKSKET